MMQVAAAQATQSPSNQTPSSPGPGSAGLEKPGKKSSETAFGTEVKGAPSATDKSLMRIEATLLESGEKLPAGLEHAYAVNPGKSGLTELLGAETALRVKRDLNQEEKVERSRGARVQVEKGAQPDAEPEVDGKVESGNRTLSQREKGERGANSKSSLNQLQTGGLTSSDTFQEQALSLSEASLPSLASCGIHMQSVAGGSSAAPQARPNTEALQDKTKTTPSPDARAANADGKAKLSSGAISEGRSQLAKAVELDPLNPEYKNDLAAAASKAA